MAYWLMKSEPDVFSVDDLRKKNVAGWDGVRNYQARNHLRAMKKGDLAFFYHSSTKPTAIVGVMEVVKEAYPDPTAEEAGWDQVDVRFVKKFSHPVSLEDIKTIPSLSRMVLLKNSRLSVQPVTPQEWNTLTEILDATPSSR
jgi:predicted RNA-binding protein with PUA-like domain